MSVLLGSLFARSAPSQLCSVFFDAGMIVSVRKDAANFGSLPFRLAGTERALALGGGLGYVHVFDKPDDFRRA